MARNQLLRCTPESQGISSAAILAFVEAVDQTVHEFHSFMLLRHGNVVAEGWWSPYRPDYPHMLFSLSKSFCSTAIGFAVDEGCLSVDDLVLSFFPEDAPAQPDDNLKAMKIHHLLSMSTGHHEDASGRTFSTPDGNWVKAFLSLPVEHEPGTHFVYNTAATYMLSAILQKVTGTKLVDYLEPRLFKPLGIKGATWESCPRGINTGGFGLNVKTEDIARFGQMYLQKGMWNGKRLISESWIEAASSKQVPNGSNPESDWNQGYGYQFWRCRHNNYRGDGAFGQYCIVMPDQDAVLAITAGLGDMQHPMNLVWEHLLSAMQPAPLPENKAAQEALTQKLSGLALLPPQVQPVTSPVPGKISGKTFRFEQNEINIKSMAFDFDETETVLTVRVREGKRSLRVGSKGWLKGRTNLNNENRPQFVYTHGVWTAKDTYQATVRYVETPFYHTWTFKFTEDQVEAQLKINVNFGPTELPTITGKIA